MPIGRFFSLHKGRVGQYLSSRVLVVKTPFRTAPHPEQATYCGFEKLSQAQKFARYLANAGYQFQLQRSQVLEQFPYEIKLVGNTEVAKVLAYWDRADQQRLAATSMPSAVTALPSSRGIAA